MNDTLKTIVELKERSGRTLAHTLEGLINSDFSEKMLSAKWLSNLQTYDDLYPEGWYAPPPNGVITVCSKPEDNFDRVCQSSFRPEFMWPRDDIFYMSDNIMLVYVSPVQRQTNLIGDFGLAFYNGSDPEIKDHFENVLKATIDIANYAKAGMPFNELYNFAMDHGASLGFQNNIDSPSDNAGTNIGHTIPLSYKTDSTHEAIKNVQSFYDIREILRTGRKFLSAAETQIIEPDMAFTIEPRFSTTTMPHTWFHHTIIFDQGEKQITHGFNPVFEVMNMNYLMKLLS